MLEHLHHPARLVFKQVPNARGLHPDPLTRTRRLLPARSFPAFRRALGSVELERYRDGLRLTPAGDVRAGVIDDLSTYFGLDPDQCVERCIHWEQASVAEWFKHRRATPDEILDFYRTTQSWTFDLLWFAYLQAEGYEFPASVVAAQYLRRREVKPGTHLDYGSGVGVTGQLFASLGYETALGDVSTSLLEFARYRLERRGQAATYLDLAARELEPECYDVITAIDTLAHVPDVAGTARQLHATMRPGGWLFANVDVRSDGAASAWHLQSDATRAKLELRRVGFRPRAVLDGLPVYQRMDPPRRAGQVRIRAMTMARANPVAEVAGRLRWPTYSKVRRRLHQRRLIRRSA